MPEQGSRWHAVTGHAKLRGDEVSRALYTLLAGFHASAPLRALASSDESSDPIACLLDENEEELLQERLIYAAVRIRIMDDYLWAQNPKYRDSSKRWIVGWMTVRGPRKEPLNLREACNKIIHAKLLNWNRTKIEGLGGPLLPSVYLYGKKDKKGWRCFVDVVEFCRRAYFVC